jgi:hypothetical protein
VVLRLATATVICTRSGRLRDAERDGRDGRPASSVASTVKSHRSRDVRSFSLVGLVVRVRVAVIFVGLCWLGGVARTTITDRAALLVPMPDRIGAVEVCPLGAVPVGDFLAR